LLLLDLSDDDSRWLCLAASLFRVLIINHQTHAGKEREIRKDWEMIAARLAADLESLAPNERHKTASGVVII
jgi:hypothetical protein